MIMSTPPAPVRIGVCPAHFGFARTLAPDDSGCLPRDSDGTLKALSRLKELDEQSPIPLSVVPMFVFSGTREDDVREALSGVRELGIIPEIILMVGGMDPMNRDHEDRFVRVAVETLGIAKSLGIDTISSTSFEEWMNEGPGKSGTDYDAAVEQVVKVHRRIYEEAELADSSIKAWHLEFLRPVEFNTFTNVRNAWDVVRRLNESISRNFFRVLVDASHCGDSGISVEENQTAIREIAAAGALGAFHASAKTTRGCLTTDQGWIDALLTTCAETGELETVIVEAFDHTDEGLGGLRAAVPGNGVDTTHGRTYDQLIIDGLVMVDDRLSKLREDGILKPRKVES